MQAFRATPASVTAAPTPQFRKIKFGRRIYSPGMEGTAWRVKSGAVRLDRVRRLCLLLTRQRADGRREVAIPSLKDIAEITNLTMATVSRAMSRLRRSGLLQRQGRRLGLMAVEAEVARTA